MTRDEVFEEIYQAIETRFLNEDIYDSTILAYIPSYEFNTFPLIVVSQLDYRLVGESLSKNEKRHELSIECQVFAIDKQDASGRVIANYLSNLVEEVIQNDFGLGLNMSSVIPNLKESIYRVVTRFNGIIYDDSKIIYRER